MDLKSARLLRQISRANAWFPMPRRYGASGAKVLTFQELDRAAGLDSGVAFGRFCGQSGYRTPCADTAHPDDVPLKEIENEAPGPCRRRAGPRRVQQEGRGSGY